MKILILSQYYPPETGACSNRISGFAREIAGRGHEVTVITGFPNYPYWKLYSGYRRSWCAEDRDGAVRLLRTWVSIRYPTRPLYRLMNYLGFFASSLYAGLFKAGRPDVVVATSGPILVGLAGALLSLLLRRPFVLDLRDVWPERIVAAGEFKNPFAIRTLEAVEKFMYARARQIVCVTRGLRGNLVEKGIPESKLSVITNGTDVKLFRPRPAGGQPLGKYGIPDGSFVVAYAGTLGLLQDHDMLLRSAERLKAYPDIYFLFAGEGVKREFVIEEARKRRLENVRFVPNLSREDLAEVLAGAAVGINSNTDIHHNEMAIPVKMFDYMASELPVVLANEGEVEKIVRDGGLGICTPPGDEESFSEAILRLYRDAGLRRSMGRRGREMAAERFSSEVLAEDFEKVLAGSANS